MVLSILACVWVAIVTSFVESPEEQGKVSAGYLQGNLKIPRQCPHLPGFTQFFCDLDALLLDITDGRQ